MRRTAAPRRWTGHSALRALVLAASALYFLLPLMAMLEFSTRGTTGRSLESWRAIGSTPAMLAGIRISLTQAVLTTALVLGLLVPTTAWVHLRVPQLRRAMELVCLLPLTIPAIVVVVGIADLYAWVTYLLGDSPLTLTFAYGVLALPYAFRAIDNGLSAMDLRTLAEAARSLGASWTTVLLRVMVPNLRVALVSAASLTMALVLGEFTLASLLNFDNLQVEINVIGKRDAGLSVAVALASMIFAFVVLFVLGFIGRRLPSTTSDDDVPAAVREEITS
ncbi:ABC transporter permease [Pedococcus sp. 5OH_020]|uniref:ABC transporter permease n=1 Tax=Pedococcus sp. 5OH_020 TaxID=2989814 RepID=UPI0022E9DF5B|nr:ABC transporter permease subunit [Pedococcus sp. 5OH_020]